MSPVTPPDQGPLDGRQWLRDPASIVFDHPAASFAAAASTLVIFRALNFTEFHIQAAIAVLATGGVEGILLGSVAALAPTLAGVAVVLAVLGLRSPRVAPSAAFGRKVALWTILIGALWTSYYLTPLLFFVVVGIGVVYFVRVIWNDIPNNPAAPFFVGGLLFSAIILIAYAPWLPPERITVRAETFTGYVLDENTNWTKILRLRGRIAIVQSDLITERVVCVPQIPLPLPRSTANDLVNGLLERLSLVPQTDREPPCPQD